MLRLDFEQLILEMVFEVGYEKLTPASVAYYLRVPIKAAEASLDDLVRDGVLELESDEDGRLFYVLPMAAEMPREVVEQTILRRAARGLGSEYSAAEIRGEAPIQEPSPNVHQYIETLTPPPPPPAPRWTELSQHPLVLHEPHRTRRDDTNDQPVVVYDEDGRLVSRDPIVNPAIPMLLSFFWPGLGQIHNGQPGKGLLMFFTSAFLWLLFLGWVVTIYSVIDAGVVSGQRAEDRARRGRRALGGNDGSGEPEERAALA